MDPPEDPVDRFRRLASGKDHAPAVDWRGYALLNSLNTDDSPQARGAGRDRQVAWRPIALAAGRRLLVGLITAVVIVFLTYLGLRMAQGEDFFSAASRALTQTPQYLGMLAKGNLGLTGEYGFSRLPIPVKEILPRIFTNSAGLLVVGLSIATLLGIPLGLLSAASRRKVWSLPALFLSIIGISIPSFLAALLLQLIVIRITQLTGSTFLPVGGFGWDEHLILPALVLAARPFAQITRVSFITFSEILDQEYIRTARSKGLFRWWILLRHIWPNALIPILTTLAVAMRFSLISLPIIEFFFGWEGVGFYLLKAISTQEYSFAIAMLLSLSLAFILVNAILEIFYRIIDPRLRESTEQSAAIEFDSVLGLIKNAPQALLRGMRNLPLIGDLFPPKPEQVMVPLTAALKDIHQDPIDEERQDYASKQAWIRGTLHNPALLIGTLLVLGLAIVTIYGVQIAPQSPYTTRGLTITNGEFKVPPFPPDNTFLLGTDLLGRDILSMILAGAQQTFILVVLVVLGRITVGFILGAISGWLHGGWLDRFFMGWVEVLASFPALLLAMVLILALDIRKGLFPFFLALTFIGWGEITQFVRAEVMRIKSMTFIESAIASGSTVARVLSRHVQPNLIPALISLTALEMGAVLMILGELGFVGIFIGGGIFAELEWMAPLFHYSDVPEWGALLGNLRTYARGYPWMAIYPSIAFFIAILAFNLFGEGLKTLIELVGVRATRWLNRYSFAGLLLVIFVLLSVKGSTGALASYRKQAEKFDGSNVADYFEALTVQAVEDRALGSIGLQTAAAWIANSFEGLGLQPAGETFTYFQHRERTYERLTGIPVLAFDLDIPELVFHRDYNVFPSIHSISGSVYAPVRFLALGKVGSYERLGYRYYELEDVDYSEEILLVLPEDMFYIDQIPHAGALVVASNPNLLQSNYTLSNYDGFGRGAPTLWVSEELANRLLAAHEIDVGDLYDVYSDLGEDDIYDLELGVEAAIQIQGAPIENDIVQHVIGHWPGFVSNQFEGIDNELFIVLAKYDCPPYDPEGGPARCEKDTAAGLAVMLEAIRAMREAEYQPYRTFIFIAYSGEGFEGGSRFQVENVDKFLEAKFGFSSAYELLGVIELGPLGPESGEGVIVTSDGSLRLTKLFAKAAGEQGLNVERVGADLDLERIFETGSTIESGSETPWIEISGMKKDQEPDQLKFQDQEYLEQVGRALTQTLMVLGRELDY
jgi:ABC-type dipeptide/oligopeptide/nickel transport system permease subunit